MGSLFEDIVLFSILIYIYRYQIGLYHLIKLFYLYHYSFPGKHFHLIHQAFPSIVYLLKTIYFSLLFNFFEKGNGKTENEDIESENKYRCLVKLLNYFTLSRYVINIKLWAFLGFTIYIVGNIRECLVVQKQQTNCQ